MASGGRRVWPAAVLAAAVASVAGCVSMPDSGPVTAVSAGPTAAGQNVDYIGSYPIAPQRGWAPWEVVSDFMLASANPNDWPVAKQYLTPRAAATWNPGQRVTVLNNNAKVAQTAGPQTASKNGQVATVTVTGTVQVTLDSSSQYVAATQAQRPGGCNESGDGCDNFTLVDSNGVWLIANPPQFLLLYSSEFDEVYHTLTLYYSAPGEHVLVPDSLYVSLSDTPYKVLNQLVSTLIQGPPDWLSGAVATSLLPKGTKSSVYAPGSTAIVNLTGPISSNNPNLGLLSAELAYTLNNLPGGQATIDGVELDINGTPWEEQGEQDPGDFSTYDPYPKDPATFAYVDSTGTARMSCGSVDDASIGQGVSIVRSGPVVHVANCAQAGATSPTAPAESSGQTTGKGHGAGRTATQNPLLQVAVSPDGKYLAEVSADGPSKDTVSIGPAVGRWTSANTVTRTVGAPANSISWDREDNVWVPAADGAWMITVNGDKAAIDFGGAVTALSIAPDGVRVAAIMQSDNPDSGSDLELFAITRSGTGQHSQPTSVRDVQGEGSPATVGSGVPLGPGLSDPTALTWYDAYNLIVVDQEGTTSQLDEVPVNGGAAQPLQGQPPNQSIASITADTTDNVLVIGTLTGKLEASAGFEGPWQQVAEGGFPQYGG
jgi:hypothetical protein